MTPERVLERREVGRGMRVVALELRRIRKWVHDGTFVHARASLPVVVTLYIHDIPGIRKLGDVSAGAFDAGVVRG